MIDSPTIEQANKPIHELSFESSFILSHLVAASENNVIGKDNHLPWNLPNDFKFFKNKTWGMPVIMGRNTYESLDKPLPGRINIVLTTNRDWKRDDATVAHSIDEAILQAKETDCKEIFIIGGAKIFQQSIEIVKRIYLTRVHATLEGDAFYPVIDKEKWELKKEDPHHIDEKHAFAYTFQTWERIGNNSNL
jgi:dihydrofolate reductase